MPSTILRILDQTNCKFIDLDPFTRRKIVAATKYFVPHARHTPSYKLGRWDGTVAFATVGGSTYINMLDKVLPVVTDAGYEIIIEDHRPQYDFQFPVVDATFFGDKVWPKGHPNAGESICLRDYQVDAINLFLKNPQAVAQIATGAGKTVLCAALSRLVEPYGRSMIIVPSKSLVGQTEEDYRNVGLDVGVYFGDRKELGHQHTICTWQSLSVLQKKSKRTELEVPIDDFVKDVVCVIIDECHSALASELRSLLTGAFASVPIRWGLTGTIPKDEHDFMSIFVSLGPVIGSIKTKDLQDQGVLADCRVDIVQLIDDQVEFTNWPDEHDYLTSDSARILWIAKFLRTITATGNTLILVNRLETGEELQKLMPDSVFIHGTVKTKKRKEAYDEVQVSDHNTIIATYGTASIGINIPRLFNLVLFEPGRSFVRVIQSAGRILRRTEDKSSAVIYDLGSSLKFAARQLSKRKAYYKEAQFPHAVRKVDWKHDNVT